MERDGVQHHAHIVVEGDCFDTSVASVSTTNLVHGRNFVPLVLLGVININLSRVVPTDRDTV